MDLRQFSGIKIMEDLFLLPSRQWNSQFYFYKFQLVYVPGKTLRHITIFIDTFLSQNYMPLVWTI
jgi:hypothetical protein